MARRKTKNTATKAIYVEANPRPCEPDLAQVHLLAFIDAFVRTDRRDRYRFLLEKRPKQFFKGNLPLDDRWCRWLDGQASFPQVASASMGDGIGVYTPWANVLIDATEHFRRQRLLA